MTSKAFPSPRHQLTIPAGGGTQTGATVSADKGFRLAADRILLGSANTFCPTKRALRKIPATCAALHGTAPIASRRKTHRERTVVLARLFMTQGLLNMKQADLRPKTGQPALWSKAPVRRRNHEKTPAEGLRRRQKSLTGSVLTAQNSRRNPTS